MASSGFSEFNREARSEGGQDGHLTSFLVHSKKLAALGSQRIGLCVGLHEIVGLLRMAMARQWFTIDWNDLTGTDACFIRSSSP